MTKTLRRLFVLPVVAAALLGLPFLGCMEETPYYEPQRYPANGPGPNGTSAFTSGEASKVGLKPVKEGARVTDAGGGADAGASVDVVEAVDDVKSGSTDTWDFLDFPDGT